MPSATIREWVPRDQIQPSPALSRHWRLLLVIACIVGLLGVPGTATATPLHIPMEDDGGGDILSPTMGNEQVALRLFGDVFTLRIPEVCPLLMAAGAIAHTPAGEFHGPDGIERYIADIWRAFPDAAFTIDERLSSGDQVTLRWSMTGHHLDTFADVPATGGMVQLDGLAVLRFEAGMIAETWLQYDRQTLVEQVEAHAVPEICPPCDLP